MCHTDYIYSSISVCISNQSQARILFTCDVCNHSDGHKYERWCVLYVSIKNIFAMDNNSRKCWMRGVLCIVVSMKT